MRPVNSTKEIVDSVTLGVAAGVTTTVTLGTAVNDYTGTTGTFPVGSKVSSIYLFVQLIPTATTENVDFYVIKRPTGVSGGTPGATGGVVGRNFILHEEKGIPGNANDGAYPLTFKGVIKIPRGRQRMAEGDVILLLGRGVGIYNMCVKCIYKNFR